MTIPDKANAIMHQIFSNTNAREFENVICDVLRFMKHVLTMDAFANTSTLTFLQTYHDENIRIVDNKYQPCIGKCVAFIFTEALIASALVEKASKLSKPDNSPIKAYAYYGNMDEKQKQKDFSNIDVI
ncbi:4565_t:CDS:2 [Funneliformis geosporum]|nr:4565_t:CDS:2 [Funneliformis geosporum]